MTGTPAPFHLPDVVLTPGKPMTGTRARVYWLLRLTAERRGYHLMDTQPAARGPLGWVPIHTLRAPWAGGAQGDRRVRDLQELHGVAYDVRRWSELGGPRDSAATLYRITSDPLLHLNPLPEGAGREVGPPYLPSPALPGDVALEPPPPPLRTDLARLRFWTLEARPPASAGTTLCVDPGLEHPLSADLSIFEAAQSGELLPAQADERYREQLLGAYRRGDFRIVSGWRHLVVWTSSPAQPWGPLPVLIRALVALGAEHHGTWQEVA